MFADKLSRQVFESVFNGIIITDSSSKILSVNRSFSEITGYAPDEVIGKNPRFLRSGRHDPDFYGEMRESLKSGGRWKGEVWSRRKNGEVFPELLSITALNEGAEVNGYIGILHDLTDYKNAQMELKYKTSYDALTSLPNRVLFNDRLSQAITHSSRNGMVLAVMFLGIDNFKRINESMGPKAGDQLLQAVAQRLNPKFRSVDTVALFGGDEFSLIFENISNVEQAAKAAKKVADSFNEPFRLMDNDVFVTASLGISMFPEDGRDAETLIKHSQLAMYRAKKEGKNIYQFFALGMNEKAEQRLLLERDLRRAIDQEEFEVHYQPKVELATGKILGVEALLRWNHPERGSVPPSVFIPVAEETGLIVEIGEFVIKEACKVNRSWQDSGFEPICVAVNLSAKQFNGHRIEDSVASALKETGLSSKYLELEITETVVMDNVNSAIQTLGRLKEMGMGLSIDDFGTGYSSFAYLKKFPIGVLKIDMVFVKDIAEKKEDAQIISAMISMAHSLGLKVVAEGVETHEQLQVLRELGCDQVQGFLCSKPLSAENAVKFFEQKIGSA